MMTTTITEGCWGQVAAGAAAGAASRSGDDTAMSPPVCTPRLRFSLSPYSPLLALLPGFFVLLAVPCPAAGLPCAVPMPCMCGPLLAPPLAKHANSVLDALFNMATASVTILAKMWHQGAGQARRWGVQACPAHKFRQAHDCAPTARREQCPPERTSSSIGMAPTPAQLCRCKGSPLSPLRHPPPPFHQAAAGCPPCAASTCSGCASVFSTQWCRGSAESGEKSSQKYLSVSARNQDCCTSSLSTGTWEGGGASGGTV